MDSIFKEICPACGNDSWTVLFRGRIRDGSFGKMTNEPALIYQCAACTLARLETFVIGSPEYESPDYRERYNDSSDDRVLLTMHDPEQAARLSLIGFDKLRDKIVVDYGCGHGAFLDAISGVANSTIGIEPLKVMHPSLKQRGHDVFGYADEALSLLRGKVDVVTSFGVIEHIEDPLEYLRNALALLSENGMLVLQTDNLDDLLMRTEAKGFADFFYRTAHNWYFRASNLEAVTRKAGFVNSRVSTTHGYDFSNFMLWHKDGRPTGNGKMKLFDPVFDSFWMASVEAAGYGDLITLIAYKQDHASGA